MWQRQTEAQRRRGTVAERKKLAADASNDAERVSAGGAGESVARRRARGAPHLGERG